MIDWRNGTEELRRVEAIGRLGLRGGRLGSVDATAILTNQQLMC